MESGLERRAKRELWCVWWRGDENLTSKIRVIELRNGTDTKPARPGLTSTSQLHRLKCQHLVVLHPESATNEIQLDTNATFVTARPALERSAVSWGLI